MALVTYVGGVTVGRETSGHGFSCGSLWKVRYQHQTAPILVAFNWVIPFAVGFGSLQFVKAATNKENGAQTMDEKEQLTTLKILKMASISATKSWANVLARIASQTALASVLIKRNTPFSNSMVLQWDAYPRMHQKYVGDLLETIRLPRVIASLLGPNTKESDVTLWSTETSPAGAAQDSFKRHALVSVSNVTITGVVHYLTYKTTEADEEGRKTLGSPRWKSLQEVLQDTATTEVIGFTGSILGAAASRALGCGGRGEYWGELVGAFAFGGVIGLGKQFLGGDSGAKK